jgi:hypothetical protein
MGRAPRARCAGGRTPLSRHARHRAARPGRHDRLADVDRDTAARECREPTPSGRAGAPSTNRRPGTRARWAGLRRDANDSVGTRKRARPSSRKSNPTRTRDGQGPSGHGRPPQGRARARAWSPRPGTGDACDTHDRVRVGRVRKEKTHAGETNRPRCLSTAGWSSVSHQRVWSGLRSPCSPGEPEVPRAWWPCIGSDDNLRGRRRSPPTSSLDCRPATQAPGRTVAYPLASAGRLS